MAGAAVDRRARIGAMVRRGAAIVRYTLSGSGWITLAIGALACAALTWALVEFSFLGAAEAALGLVTLGSVWLIEKRRQWLESIPRRLTVVFWYPEGTGDSHARWRRWCAWHDAFLAGESAIRETAQSLGQILAGGRRLKLTGQLLLEDENPVPVPDEDGWVRRYVAHLPLVELPTPGPPSGGAEESEDDGGWEWLRGREAPGVSPLYERSVDEGAPVLHLDRGAFRAFRRQVLSEG